ITKFEILPNELLLVTFDYLDSSDVLFTFSNLNHRLDNLLQASYRHLHFDFRLIKKSKFDFICQIWNIHHIHTLILSDDDNYTCGLINLFLNLFQLQDFINLNRLELFYVNSYLMETILPSLYHLKTLTYLSILEHQCSRQIIENVCRTIFLNNAIPTLKYFIISNLNYDVHFNHEEKNKTNIEYLSIG
ncbi:unnamed protein product, partial [Didymodactylos carnosus]